jgi:hypothetical protein
MFSFLHALTGFQLAALAWCSCCCCAELLAYFEQMTSIIGLAVKFLSDLI